MLLLPLSLLLFLLLSSIFVNAVVVFKFSIKNCSRKTKLCQKILHTHRQDCRLVCEDVKFKEEVRIACGIFIYNKLLLLLSQQKMNVMKYNQPMSE